MGFGLDSAADISGNLLGHLGNAGRSHICCACLGPLGTSESSSDGEVGSGFPGGAGTRGGKLVIKGLENGLMEMAARRPAPGW